MGIGTRQKAKYNPLSEIRVVVDTGPLLHLMEAGCLNLLPVIGSVEAPDAALAEMQVLLDGWEVPPWLSVSHCASDSIAKVDAWYRAGVLGRGESEAIALTLERGTTWLLTDDAEARLVASGLGVEVHGFVGIVLFAAAIGVLDQDAAQRALVGLVRSTLWISRAVETAAYDALRTLFAHE